MRKKIVAGNWKMNLNQEESIELANSLHALDIGSADVKVFASAIHLHTVNTILKNKIEVGAQNIYYKNSGAFTGEISPSQVKSYGLGWTLIGHSERRSIFGEDNELLKQKVDAALENGLKVMFCFGETLEERESGNAENVVKQQLAESVFHLSDQQWQQIVLAYEPVWAIGTGIAATPAQAQDMHAYIRSLLVEQYNANLADNTTILYGGSVKPNNAQEIFANPDIDGGLIGGASLQAAHFSDIIKAL